VASVDQGHNILGSSYATITARPVLSLEFAADVALSEKFLSAGCGFNRASKEHQNRSYKNVSFCDMFDRFVSRLFHPLQPGMEPEGLGHFVERGIVKASRGRVARLRLAVLRAATQARRNGRMLEADRGGFRNRG
jgi:hypothetical protein